MNSKSIKILIVVLIVAVLCVAGYYAWSYKKLAQQNTSGYQAVFLTNNQVYFGKLSSAGKWLKLTDIYYLQATQPLQQSETTQNSSNQSNLQLVKLGSELHGPQDVMYIEHDKVLFWENLKDDSKVVDAIKKHKSGQK